MLVSSTLTSQAQRGVLSDGEVMLLSYGSKRTLVQVPSNYEDLVDITRDVFAIRHGKVVFETADLDICAGEAAEIHSRVWSSICNVVGTVSVSVVTTDCPRHPIASCKAQNEDVGKENICPPGARLSLQGSVSASRRPSASGKGVLSPREESSQDYDKLADEMENIPHSDELEDQLDEYDDDYYEEQPASPSKGKGKGRVRNRIMSDDEEEDEEQVEEQMLAPSSSRTTVSLNRASPAASRVSAERDVKSFSSPKIRASPRDVDDLFSPKEKVRPEKSSSSLRHGIKEEEEGEEEADVPSAKRAEEGVKLLFKDHLQTPSPVSSPRKETYIKESIKISLTETKTESTASPKPASSKFKPAVRASVSREPSVSSRATEERAPAKSKKQAVSEEKSHTDEKIFVTISHPPSGVESKFKFKGKHAVGRVLMSACQAFQLEFEGSKLMLLDEEYLEDGIEMTSELSNHDTMHEAGVVSGNHLVISLAADQ